MGLAALSMPLPLGATAPGVGASAATQRVAPLADVGGWGDYVGTFTSAAACVATAGALGAAKRRQRRRGGGANLAGTQRQHTVVPLVEAPEVQGGGSSSSMQAALSNEVAEMRQAVQVMQQQAWNAVSAIQPLQLHQSQHQFAAVGWIPVFFPVEPADAGGYYHMFGEQLVPPVVQGVPVNMLPSDHPESAMPVSKDEATSIIKELSVGDAATRQSALEWVMESAWLLANSYEGSRIVQKAFDVAHAADQVMLRQSLRGHVMEALRSPHANHVLQKCIEVTPASQLHFVADEMQGNVALAAKHRYGCRILERLIEHHCAALPIEALMDEIVAEASSLCRHSFANFVVQHVLEHGSSRQKANIAEVLLSDVCRLAKHRVASHVVQSALVYASLEDRARLKQAMSSDTAELEDIRKTQCGRFVVDEMVRV